MDDAAVAERHGDPIGAFDDVVVGEDVAGGVDDEAAAGSFVRRRLIVAEVAAPARRGPSARVGSARCGVDVDDRGIEARGNRGEIDRGP